MKITETLRRKTPMVCWLAFALAACGGGSESGREPAEDLGTPPPVMEPPPAPPGSITKVPRIKGQMVYHHYSSYEARDSMMYLYDFEANTLQRISDGWNIRHAMNAHFSPDGRQIVFMGLRHDADVWDVYLYDLVSGAHPVNLTPGDSRDEEPKFSPDGRRIVFKRNLKLAEMDVQTRAVRLLTTTDDEYSMPYYNAAGTQVVASKGDGARSSIALIDVRSQQITTLYDAPGVQDYYPINADETSFYYSVGYSTANRVDQIHRGYWNGAPSQRLPFNDTDGDYSDAFPAGSDWVVLSSTRAGGRGSYDLYIANVVSGEIFPMTDYHPNINTSKAELGAVVFMQK